MKGKVSERGIRGGGTAGISSHGSPFMSPSLGLLSCSLGLWGGQNLAGEGPQTTCPSLGGS